MISKYTLVLVTALALATACSSPRPKTDPVSPNKETISPAALGFSMDSLVKIDVALADFVEKKYIPGATVLVARHGKIAYQTAVGWRDIEKQIPLKQDDIFRLASMTKPVTTVAILQLYEAGKLKLNDPVSKFIPEFDQATVLTSLNKSDTTWSSTPARSAVTISQLLAHTSGIKYGFSDPEFGAIYAKLGVPDGANPLPIKIDQAMSSLAKAPLAFHPGESWQYGLSTDVLGRVVEVASGQTLDQYIYDNILKPLQLKNTWFFAPDTTVEQLATAYFSVGDTAIAPLDPHGFIQYPTKGAKSYLSGGSGLNGTARDYFTFCQALLNGGKWQNTRLLQDSTTQLLSKNQIDTLTYPWGEGTFSYGFHLLTENQNKPPFGRAGRISWGGIFHTTFWIDPDRDIVGILMSQVLSNPHGKKVNDTFEKLVNNALIDERK